MKGWFTSIVGVVLALCAAAHAQPAELKPNESAPPVEADETRAPCRREAGYIGKCVPMLEIETCPTRDPVSPEELQRIGREHFGRGEVLYVQGDYPGAVKELVAAYCIQPYYTILKDIGQAYERELDYERAIAYFEKYVLSVPKDAVKTDACAADPQTESDNLSARIKVLRNLRAKIRVNTDPPRAKVKLVDYQGTVAARGLAGDELAVLGGHYEVVVEEEGYHSVDTQIDVEIGKPYTIFSKLDPLKGSLHVRVVPADARLFLQYPSGDKLQVGTGSYESELPGGKYRLYGEANGRVSVARDIEVLAGQPTSISLDLPPVPQFGRRQLIAYTTVASAFAAGAILGATEDPTVVTAGTGAGLAAGFFGSYYATPHDIPLGTSSLTITSSLIGLTLGREVGVLTTSQDRILYPVAGAGALLGGAMGLYVGDRTHIRPGDAAIINSGAIWGTTTGILFAQSFQADRRTGAGLVMSGLGMGTLGGILVTRYFTVSRTRAALIDVGGVVGILTGLAIQASIATAQNSTGNQSESQTNFVLGGMATGLLVAGIVTRNMDAPKLVVNPTVTKTPAGTTMFGVGGAF